jgi:hypothetical protein
MLSAAYLLICLSAYLLICLSADRRSVLVANPSARVALMLGSA